MPTEHLEYTGTLTVVTCWCGTTYAISADLYNHMRQKRDNGGSQPNVYCPLGHTWIISGKGKAEIEREKREVLERQLANRDETLRIERASHASTKAQLTRAKRRASKGVCPVDGCKRSFVDVARHVATKHPEFAHEHG